MRWDQKEYLIFLKTIFKLKWDPKTCIFLQKHLKLKLKLKQFYHTETQTQANIILFCKINPKQTIKVGTEKLGHFYWYGLTWISAWISRYIHYKLWDEIISIQFCNH